jgi:hypothetical protein
MLLLLDLFLSLLFRGFLPISEIYFSFLFELIKYSNTPRDFVTLDKEEKNGVKLPINTG